MGKRSVRENKNIYQQARERADLTREKAAEKLIFLSADRIEKIESEKVVPHPDEILTMAEGYRCPSLINGFCSRECPIGQKYVPEARQEAISQIVLELLSSLNAMSRWKDRLVDIMVDGRIHEDEEEDFTSILKELARLSGSSQSLRFWVESQIAEGIMDPVLFPEKKQR